MNPHTWDQYCNDRRCAGPFENQMLYAMCRNNSAHISPYVTAGKITSIGRIYSASPERGAGKAKATDPQLGLSEAIGNRLAKSILDEKLKMINFEEQFSATLIKKVVDTHTYLVGEIRDASVGWSALASNPSWRARNHRSFASKYLHFHRPNAFPIMDSLARAGLTRLGFRGGSGQYKQFCEGIGDYIANLPLGWTLRSLDTMLVNIGRGHSGERAALCGCNFSHTKVKI